MKTLVFITTVFSIASSFILHEADQCKIEKLKYSNDSLIKNYEKHIR